MILAVFEQQYGTRLQCKHPWLPTLTPCDSACLRPGKSLGRWDEFSLQTLASGYEMTKFTFSHAKQCVARFLPSIFYSTERKIYIAGKCGKHRTRTETEARASRESGSSADGKIGRMGEIGRTCQQILPQLLNGNKQFVKRDELWMWMALRRKSLKFVLRMIRFPHLVCVFFVYMLFR